MSALNRHSPSDTTSLSTSSASVSDRSDYSPTSSITSSEMRLSDQLPSPKFATSRGFSLLPPSHPLRAQLCTQVEGEMSPPRTPKGHPIDQQSKSYFPLSLRATKVSFAVSDFSLITSQPSTLRHRANIKFAVSTTAKVSPTHTVAIILRIRLVSPTSFVYLEGSARISWLPSVYSHSASFF